MQKYKYLYLFISTNPLKVMSVTFNLSINVWKKKLFKTMQLNQNSSRTDCQFHYLPLNNSWYTGFVIICNIKSIVWVWKVFRFIILFSPPGSHLWRPVTQCLLSFIRQCNITQSFQSYARIAFVGSLFNFFWFFTYPKTLQKW